MKYSYLVLAGITSLIYFVIAVLLLNATLVGQTLLSTTSIWYKSNLILLLITGFPQTVSSLDVTLLMLTSLLVGANIAISLALVKKLQAMGKVRFAFGGGTMVGVFATGCAGCGFSAFSLFGASGAIALLPFRGMELYVIAITLLAFSLYYGITNLSKPVVCKV